MHGVLTVDRADQLKALGHPLRLRVLELLGESDDALTNRELAARLGVDPGHLHFHVRMLVRAGLIELADTSSHRQKPYRAVARTVRVAPELVSAGASTNLQATMLDEVQRAFGEFAPSGQFRFLRVSVRLDPERAFELLTDLAERADEIEDEDAEPIVIAAATYPPPAQPDDAADVS